MNIKKIIVFFFCVLLHLSWLKAQNTINSKLINKTTGEPVVFATIRIKGKNLATISDENGNFRIPQKHKTTKDTLQISSIGYESKLVIISSLQENTINIIRLNEVLERLSEVVVYSSKNKVSRKGVNNLKNENPISAEEIVRNAINKIPVNCPRTPYSYVGYYRDYQFQDDEYTNLNEALVEVFDEGFQTNKSFNKKNQTQLLEYKTNADFKIDSTTTIAYDNNKDKLISNAFLSSFGGNELSILNIHDPIRNYNLKTFSAINTLRKDFIPNHQFRIVKIIPLDKTLLYHIKFSTEGRIVNPKFYGNGDIYIEKGNFAIHKLEYNGFKSKIIESIHGLPPKFVKEEAPFFSLKLEYARHNNLMYLNYISFNNVFQIRNDFKITDITYNDIKNEFILRFNKPIDSKTALRIKNYKFTYLKKGLKVKSVKLLGKNGVSVQIEDKVNLKLEGSVTEGFGYSLDNSAFGYKLKGIRDVENQKLDLENYRSIDQYREFFVQKVFPSKKLPEKTLFMYKSSPLSKNKNRISDNDVSESYWINTPLKRNKSD